jgi:hypothetical protein
MKNFCKLGVMAGVTFLSFGMPAVAQIANGVDFTTSFPFCAGNAKMPAGAYTITQPADEDNTVFLIQSKDGSHVALLDIAPTQAANPHSKTDISFNKYGGTEYLSQVWVGGQSYGMQVTPTKVEQTAAAEQHSVPAKAGENVVRGCRGTCRSLRSMPGWAGQITSHFRRPVLQSWKESDGNEEVL